MYVLVIIGILVYRFTIILMCNDLNYICIML